MIQVDPIPRRPASLVGRTRASAGFSMAGTAAAPPAGGAAVAALEAGLLLGLQEEPAPRPAAVRDQAARRRCAGLVEALARVQRALLGGGGTGPALEGLRSLAGEPVDAADPGLRQALSGAVTRARIELARLELPRLEPSQHEAGEISQVRV